MCKQFSISSFAMLSRRSKKKTRDCIAKQEIEKYFAHPRLLSNCALLSINRELSRWRTKWNLKNGEMEMCHGPSGPASLQLAARSLPQHSPTDRPRYSSESYHPSMISEFEGAQGSKAEMRKTRKRISI